MKTLFLNPPFIDRYDSAGARFQATRRSKSMWYPVWLAHGAALCGEKADLLDGPAEGMGFDDAVKRSSGYECVVFYTSAPSFSNDALMASKIKKMNNDIKIIFTGPHVSVLPEESLRASLYIDAAATGEFDLAVKEISEGKSFEDVKGIVWRKGGTITRNPKRDPMIDMDSLPFVSPVYKKYLPIRKYYLPFALFPYISIYSGRGCPYKCTFCLWPQTFTGRSYRKRSIGNVIEEVRFIKKSMPEVKEIFFDDDTFTVDKKWVSRFCDAIGPLKVRWSINARADVPFDILKELKRAGCRLLVVGYESGDDIILSKIKKGISSEEMEAFTRDCNRAGLMIHGTFVLGLPGENRETVSKTINFARRLNIDTLQCSIAMPLPGTEFHEEVSKKDYLVRKELVTKEGFQLSPVSYPWLSARAIEESAVLCHKKFYNRPWYLLKLLSHAMKGPDEAYRVFSVGMEYLRFIKENKHF